VLKDNRASAAIPLKRLTCAYIGLGSNLGERRQSMDAAVEKMNQLPGVRVTKLSSFYETEPVGGPPQPTYLNAVVEIECSLSASELLSHLQRIENEMGREREGKDFPRTIDLDILFFGDDVIDEPNLKVPHPRLHERLFMLDPLNEIAPEVLHPVLGETVAALRRALLDGRATSRRPKQQRKLSRR